MQLYKGCKKYFPDCILYVLGCLSNMCIFSLQDGSHSILICIWNIHSNETQNTGMDIVLVHTHTHTVLSITYSFLSSERPVCQQCSGSIPKVNKLTHCTERIVNGLPPSRGQSEWSVLFGQLSRGLRRPARRDDLTDGRTGEPNEPADEQIGEMGMWYC